jgi:hypothetical protein
MAHAKAALGFFEENWGHPFADGLFWFALGALRSGKRDDARQAAGTLKIERPDYPKLENLLEAIG